MKNIYKDIFPFEFHDLREMFHDSCLYYGIAKDESLRLAAVVACQMIPKAHRNNMLRSEKSLFETALKNREDDQYGEALDAFRERLNLSVNLINEIGKMNFGFFSAMDRKRELISVAPVLADALNHRNSNMFKEHVLEIREKARGRTPSYPPIDRK